MHHDQLLPRELLLFRIWGNGMEATSRAVDVSMYRLRRALARLGCSDLLQTIKGRGYRLERVAAPLRSAAKNLHASQERHIRSI
jgi:two-component system phosphate regulon response regulator PhoB